MTLLFRRLASYGFGKILGIANKEVKVEVNIKMKMEVKVEVNLQM